MSTSLVLQLADLSGPVHARGTGGPPLERFDPEPEVLPSAMVTIGHDGDAVAHIGSSWVTRDDRLCARAEVFPGCEGAVRLALARSKSASLEFVSRFQRSIPGICFDDPSVMTFHGARISAVGLTRHPARDDCRVLHIDSQPETVALRSSGRDQTRSLTSSSSGSDPTLEAFKRRYHAKPVHYHGGGKVVAFNW